MLRIVACFGFALALSAQAQLVSEFNPPKEDCCPRMDAQRLADHLQDFNNLGYYHAANERIASQPADSNRVVFLGDSITEDWNLAQYFPGKPYVNRAVSGETTSQMLVRTFPDVIDLHPAVMVLMGGTNDIAANNGPETIQMVEENIQAITELAEKHGIKVVLGAVMPVNDYEIGPVGPMTRLHPAAQIVALDKWIHDYAERSGAIYCDLYAAVVDDKGFLRQGYSLDGLHPNVKGYQLMAPAVQAAINKAFAGSGG